MLALAFPDRIAKARGKYGEFLLANGRAASLQPYEPIAGAAFLAIGEVTGRAGASRILLAAPLDEDELALVAGRDIVEEDSLRFEPDRAALQARRIRRLGAIVLSEANRAVPGDAEAAALPRRGAGCAGDRTPALDGGPAAMARTASRFLRMAEGEDWPDVSDEALAADVCAWLAPHIEGITSLAGLGADRLGNALSSLLPWDKALRLEAEAPEFYETPAGARHRLDYAAAQGPTLSVRVQELYGLATHPSLARGRVPIVLELLSPGRASRADHP